MFVVCLYCELLRPLEGATKDTGGQQTLKKISDN